MNEIFFTKHYHVLEVLNHYTVRVDSTEEFCPIEQDKVAELVHLSRNSVNKIFSVLREQEYIEMISRGKWKITPKGKHVVTVISKLKEDEGNMSWIDDFTKIKMKNDDIERVVVKLYNQDAFLKSIIIPTEYYPLPSGKIKTFDYRNTNYLTDNKIKDAFDSSEYVIGKCWDNCLKLGKELQKRNIEFQYYGGWLFISNLIPVFHSWIEYDGNVLDLANMNTEFQTEMKNGRTEEDIIRFHSHVKKVSNSERCNLGKVYEELFYVGVPMNPEKAKNYYQNLLDKFPDHETGINISKETGLNRTQTLLKENNLS